MSNRFGLKDLVVIALLLAVALAVWLGMLQRDRQWDRLVAIDGRLATLEQQAARIESGLEVIESTAQAAIEASAASGPATGAVPSEGAARLAPPTDSSDAALRALEARLTAAIAELRESVDRLGIERGTDRAAAAGWDDDARWRPAVSGSGDEPAAAGDAAGRGGDRIAIGSTDAVSDDPGPHARAPTDSRSGAHSGVGSGEGAAAGDRAGRDASWARPDAPILWQPAPSYATDPRDEPGYAPGGEFIEVLEAEPATITPFIATDAYARRVQELVCERLAAFDPRTLELRGQLAEAWQVDPEQRWLRVRLHPRARFADGRPVTAEDVRWTWSEFLANPVIDAARARSTLDAIESVEAVDEHTVEFTFSRPLFNNVAAALASIFVLPRHFYGRFTPEFINRSTGLLAGSGRYRVVGLDPDRQWAPGQPILLERNPQHWAQQGGLRAPFDRVRFKTIRDEAVRLKAYESGDGDMMMPSSIQYELRSRDPAFVAEHRCLEWFNMQSSYTFIAWQCGERNGRPTPFADARVRRAMTQILDRDRMLRDIWAGVGRVATGPMVSESPTWNAAIAPWPFDLGAARALLAEAGWRDPAGTGRLRNAAGEAFRFEFTIPQGGEVIERIVSYVRDQCARVGIECEVRVLDWTVYSQVQRTRDFDAIVLAWGATMPESDPRQVFHSSQILDQGDNFMQWRSPEADRLIDAIRAEFDRERRMALWHEFHAVIHEEQPLTFIREAPWLRFVRRSVGNVHPYRTGLETWEFFRLQPPPAARR
ncbi:MAG TPA: ABC transporter substrate-binding protein [Phycisphaerales bacterium]|nr:ABC transporter substrate-binding protein [Phycisphaerales bacterium]HMP35960.1 ABC transporter substrate-binding protein [Phycisphaerales bacterium]